MKKILFAAVTAALAVAAQAGDKVKGAELAQKGGCVACHGEGLNKPIDPSYPKIAGQHEDYLYAALKAYKTDNNPNVGRTNGIMKGVVQPFSLKDLKDLAAYSASLPGDLKTVPESRFR